jgi:hypothetical protein
MSDISRVTIENLEDHSGQSCSCNRRGMTFCGQAQDFTTSRTSNIRLMTALRMSGIWSKSCSVRRPRHDSRLERPVSC